jgi:hypothetical protein
MSSAPLLLLVRLVVALSESTGVQVRAPPA